MKNESPHQRTKGLLYYTAYGFYKAVKYGAYAGIFVLLWKGAASLF